MSLYFTREHEWIRVEGDTATVGISDHAQQALGDIVFAEVPEAGAHAVEGPEAAVVESVKAASTSMRRSRRSDRGNPAVADDPALINSDPEGEGWFFKLRLDERRRARRPDGRSRLPRVGEDRSEPSGPPRPASGTRRLRARRRLRAELGAAALDLLDPQPGERILDVGCGDGALSLKIIERGAEVVGVDNSPEMVEAARAAGVYATADGCRRHAIRPAVRRGFLQRHAALDARQGAGRAAIFEALKLGGRFAGEMGGEGNLARLREALDEELVIRGYSPPLEAANWYPSVEEFAAVYEAPASRTSTRG
jgi:glycine cleavage system H lipoate-binding protein